MHMMSTDTEREYTTSGRQTVVASIIVSNRVGREMAVRISSSSKCWTTYEVTPDVANGGRDESSDAQATTKQPIARLPTCQK
ncbi:hypothetical protein EVAR_39007_1 [Eumeta japonica]|uniref:Uncharacterized protein n=1 Tax=Eumeta variegata TaxID=151549 RepID=A0A4C1WRU8_EUMVA|nr:hypothetical protein EVAR_39007_1 [Eumeta japonica]